jgi:hypothetical protein
MKRRILWVLVILVIGIFPLNLFSVITSRIEGTVLDESTGQPIVGAEVHLLYDLSIYRKGDHEWVKRTDSRGFFQYNDLLAGEYYIAIYKEGYELYGPCTKEKLKGERRVPDFFGGTISLIPRSVKNRIYLKEGEIKHFKISLRQEAIVKVLFTKKTDKGETPLESIYGSNKVNIYSVFYGASLVLLESQDHFFQSEVVLSPSIFEPGKVIFDNLSGEQSVELHVYAYDYPTSPHEIYLKSGETTTIHHVLDFTSGMVVHGFIRPKNISEPISIISRVNLEGPDYRVKGIIEEDKEFWLKGMKEGECKLHIKLFKIIPGNTIEDNRTWVIKDVIVLDLKKDQGIELDLKY